MEFLFHICMNLLAEMSLYQFKIFI